MQIQGRQNQRSQTEGGTGSKANNKAGWKDGYQKKQRKQLVYAMGSRVRHQKSQPRSAKQGQLEGIRSACERRLALSFPDWIETMALVFGMQLCQVPPTESPSSQKIGKETSAHQFLVLLVLLGFICIVLFSFYKAIKKSLSNRRFPIILFYLFYI